MLYFKIRYCDKDNVSYIFWINSVTFKLLCNRIFILEIILNYFISFQIITLNYLHHICLPFELIDRTDKFYRNHFLVQQTTGLLVYTEFILIPGTNQY